MGEKKEAAAEKCPLCQMELVEKPSLGFGSESKKSCPNPHCPSKERSGGWGA